MQKRRPAATGAGMTDADLEARYRRYLDRLNAHRPDDLGEFVCDELTYNGRPMTRRDYQNLLVGDLAAIPDLFFHVDRLVVAGDLVACRLHFHCTPRGEFLGLRANGDRTISFVEHVFYRFHGGKIGEVWSLIDRPAIEAQLALS